MTAPLDEKGLEAAAKALYEDDDVWSNAFAWPDLAEKQTPASRYRELAATAIRAYLAASPSPSMEMEVVRKLRYRVNNPSAWPEGFDQSASDLMAEAADDLSQAQSALAAMRAEVDRLNNERDEQAEIAANSRGVHIESKRLSAQVLRLTEENEALRKERDGKEAEFRDKVALGATDAEILRFRDSYPNPAGGSKVFYRYTIEQARYRYADAVLSARSALKENAL